MGRAMFARRSVATALAAIMAGCAVPQAPVTDMSSADIGVTIPATVMVSPASHWTQQCEKWDDWNTPGPPYRIHGDTYYVGTCGIASILVASPQGHVLIDSGTSAGAQVVLTNIRSLGLDPADVAILLMSHEHYDHVGGMRELAAATGAAIVATPDAAKALETGQVGPRDPQYGMHDPMAPVAVQRIVESGQDVRLGSGALAFEPIATPGHTPGALSWRWDSCDASGDCKSIVYADSLSPVSSETYRFSDHPRYVAAYRAGLDRLASAKCDILITPHPSSSGMVERLLSGKGLEDPAGCTAYAESIGKRLDQRLAEEARTGNDR